MKVMGSALMVFQAIVIGLAMPVAIVVGGYPKGQTVTVGLALMLLCFLAIGGLRRDRRTALVTGSVVQLVVIAAGISIRPYLTPGIIFLLVWVLAVILSAKTDANKTVN